MEMQGLSYPNGEKIMMLDPVVLPTGRRGVVTGIGYDGRIDVRYTDGEECVIWPKYLKINEGEMPQGKPDVLKCCLNCGKEFRPRTANHRCCSSRCQRANKRKN